MTYISKTRGIFFVTWVLSASENEVFVHESFAAAQKKPCSNSGVILQSFLVQC